jgi:excisionase family DNA binding protein
MPNPLNARPTLQKPQEFSPAADYNRVELQQLLTVKKVAQVLQLLQATIYKKLGERRLNGPRLGMRRRFS